MSISIHFPRPDDDDADYTETLRLDLGRFLDALDLTPGLPHGFGLHDVHKVELAWEFLDVDAPAHGYLVELVDGRRLVLEVLRSPEDEGDQASLTIEPLAPGALPIRPPFDESLAPWYDAHHITLYIAELKLLPRSLG